MSITDSIDNLPQVMQHVTKSQHVQRTLSFFNTILNKMNKMYNYFSVNTPMSKPVLRCIH